MLRRWIAETKMEEFRSSYLQREPCAGSASDTCGFEWSAFGKALPHVTDVLVVRRGELIALPPPTTLGKLVEGFRIGVGLVVRGAERLAPELRAICDDFSRELGPARIQLFATAGGVHGFGWHFDDEDVFIVQTAGIKDYYFRENTIGNRLASGDEFKRYAEEGSPLHTATLGPGDFLYLPARWWHVAEPREHSLSISVGVTPRRASAVAQVRASRVAATHR